VRRRRNVRGKREVTSWRCRCQQAIPRGHDFGVDELPLAVPFVPLDESPLLPCRVAGAMQGSGTDFRPSPSYTDGFAGALSWPVGGRSEIEVAVVYG
jgi:hypothetical protein